eukprot:3472664-Pyramimonas_sp.AAC.1
MFETQKISKPNHPPASHSYPQLRTTLTLIRNCGRMHILPRVCRREKRGTRALRNECSILAARHARA